MNASMTWCRFKFVKVVVPGGQKGPQQVKGLKPKLHDLTPSMGENKSLNLKDKTSVKLFERYHAIDTHIKFCVGTSSSVTL
jgi:hypothetical protein